MNINAGEVTYILLVPTALSIRLVSCPFVDDVAVLDMRARAATECICDIEILSADDGPSSPEVVTLNAMFIALYHIY